MRVIVTGATGFLGGALSRKLASDGHEVIAMGRDRARLAGLSAYAKSTLEIDLASPPILSGIEADAVVHCAAKSSPWGHTEDFVRANITGTRTAIGLARRSGARRFVHISTPSIYFQFRDQPNVSESTPLPRPVNAYAHTKREAERLVLDAMDMDPIILRPRGIYGRDDTTLLPRLMKAAARRALPLMNEGRAATDLTHVDDVVDAAIAALNVTTPLQQRIFNISGGEALNVRHVANAAGRLAGIDVRWRRMPASVVFAYARAAELLARLDPRNVEPSITRYSAGLFAFTQTLDISAAAKQLSWRPKVSFADGLESIFLDAAQ